MVTNGIIAIFIGYLLGSIPTAYIAGRLVKNMDIRRVGGGNVGARNVFVEIGKKAGVIVGVVDVAKGAAAVAIAFRLLNVPLNEPHPFVLAAAIAAIVGHIWSIWLKFSGGNGLATTIGAVSVLMPYGILIVIALVLILIAITRNPILSVNISLLSLPFSAWLLFKSMPLVLFSAATLLILILHFLPTVRAARLQAGSNEKFMADLLRKDVDEKKAE